MYCQHYLLSLRLLPSQLGGPSCPPENPRRKMLLRVEKSPSGRKGSLGWKGLPQEVATPPIGPVTEESLNHEAYVVFIW